MESTWTESEQAQLHLPHAAWIVALVLLTAYVGPNIFGWAITAFISVLIYPKFWFREGRQPRGLGVRTMLAVLFTCVIAYTAWSRINLPTISSEVEDTVAANLRDPSSAEFLDVIEGSTATCGEVNGKNAFGAYVGFKPFVYENGRVLFEPVEPSITDIEQRTAYYRELGEFAKAQQRCYE